MAKVSIRRRELRTKSGEVLTDADIERLAEEAEAGYDLSLARWIPFEGSASDNGVSPRVSVRLSEQLFEEARDRAAREGRSLSDLVREAIERYMRGA